MSVDLMLFTKEDCPNCPQAKKVIEDLKGELGDRIAVRRYLLDDEEDLLTALQHQVMSTPAVVVEGQLVCSGRPVAKAEVLEAVLGAERGR
jgi:hypothetical protein